jgi:hypothetical protein
MTLRIAPCPRCQAFAVLGERACRNCGQPFEYGPSPPPVPSTEQIVEALRAAGVLPAAGPPAPTPASSSDVLAPPVDVAVRPAAVRPAAVRAAVSVPDAAPVVEAAPAVAAAPAGVDSGRFHVGDVVPDEVPGLIDSTLFAAWTPAHVDVEAVPGLETTAVAAAVAVPAARLTDLELAHAAVGDVAVDRVPGVYHSDMFAAGVDVVAGAAAAGPVLEVSPGALRPTARAARKASGADGLTRLACPGCGTVHAAARCPSCATAHPDL